MATPAPLTPGAEVRRGNAGFATSLALLVLRGALAWMFIFHGAQKLFGAFDGPGLSGFAQYLRTMPVLPPYAWAVMAALGEFGGGVLMGLGLLTRLAALDLIVVMCVAIATMTGANGFSLPGGYEINMLVIAVCIALLLAGAGPLSADALLFRRSLWARGPQPMAP